jgi:hypothetical protein
MKYALARPSRTQPRFFAGRYLPGDPMPLPVTTGQPDHAKTYEDRVVAELMMAYLNLLVGIATGVNSQPWIIMPLPEAWT